MAAGSPYRVGHVAVSNVFRMAGGAATNIYLPLTLALLLPPRSYALWALAFSIASYISYFDLGFTATVASFTGQEGRADATVRARWVLLRSARAIALLATGLVIVVSLLGYVAPDVMPGLSATEQQTGSLLIAALSVGNAAVLTTVVPVGFFVGLGRATKISGAIVGTRLLTAFACSVAADRGASLAMIATVFTAGSLGTAGLTFAFAFREPVNVSVGHLAGDDKDFRQSFKSQTYGMMRWSLAMFAVSGLDTLIVSIVHFSAVGAYALALTVVGAVASLDNSLVNAHLPVWSARVARHLDNRRQILSTSSTNVGLLLGAGSASVIAMHALGRISGSQAVEQSTTYLLVLMAAAVVRQTGAPLALGFIAAQKTREAFAAPGVEAMTNGVLSVVLGVVLGPDGVALGTLGGAVAGIVCIALVTAPRHLKVSGREILSSIVAPSCARGVVVAVPVSLALLSGNLAISALCLASVVTLSLRSARDLVRES